MNTSLEVLEAEVLQLPPADRSHLLERLIASLDADPEVEEAWAREVKRREAELDSGAVAAIPGEQAIGQLRERLARASSATQPWLARSANGGAVLRGTLARQLL